MVGLLLHSVRIFKQFSWLKAGSVKVAVSRPAHQLVTQIVRQPVLENVAFFLDKLHSRV